jgi:hypothetical protein
MRKFAGNVLVCAALFASGCTSTGDLPPGATDVTLANGIYQASFAGGCSTMTIAEDGRKIHYTAGPCGGAPNFTSPGHFDGSETIRIMQATYKLSDVTKTSLTGRWRLGTYTTIVTFRM